MALPGSPLQALGSRLHNIDDNTSNTTIIKVTKYLPEGPVSGTPGHYLPLPITLGRRVGKMESPRGGPCFASHCRGSWPPLGPSGKGPGALLCSLKLGA